MPDGDVRGHWFIDLAEDDPDYAECWKLRSTGEKVKKAKNLLVSTQTGFEMITNAMECEKSIMIITIKRMHMVQTCHLKLRAH